ncbi:YdbL family protein [Marinobacterium litorale]|jgi:uncharacterized protein YdbL (DUF1318 family)|uniref:YdbL family protein n=1 Tax=Marinobacterium litorale TaxID=404770 RepID=UPI00041AA0BD|nr:YdbL family protein [Marinobacterium litorale]
MTSTLKALGIALLLATSTPLWALSLDDAKQQGLIGEQSNGYLGVVVDSPSAEVRSLVDSINEQRRSLYIEKAEQAGVKPQIMELRMGERLLERAPNGEFVRTPDGRWVRK